ncbi:MAG: VCBS repeat-containing protein [Deltaproteobacteria bacterium]|nr:VCBS repeat-containing protein [Deltaproteobacteria bacterium]
MPSQSRFDQRLPLFTRRVPRAATPLALLLVLVQAAAAQSPTPFGGSFQFDPLPPIEVNAGSEPTLQAFTLGDLDRDGQLDLVVAEADQDRVAVYWGEGNGQFSDPTFVETEVAPVAVVVQDVASNFDDGSTDADGIPDIVLSGDGGEIQVLLGIDGERNFEGGQLYDELDLLDSVGLVVADFDRTGPQDIAVIDSFGTVAFLCSTDGTYTPCATASFDADGETTRILGGDFDGDSFIDVAILNVSERGIKFLYGNGRGSFIEDGGIQGRLDDICDDPVAATTADFNGDAIKDLAFVTSTNFGDNCVRLMRPRRRNQVTNTNATNNNRATDLRVADFDGDSIQDFVLTQNQSDDTNFVSIGIGNGEAEFDLSLLTPAPGVSVTAAAMVEVANLGGDSLPEIILLVVNDDEANEIQVMLNTANSPRNTPTAPGRTGTPTVTSTGPPPPTSTPTPTVPTATATATNTPTPIPTVSYSRCDLTIGGGSFASIVTGNFDGDRFTDFAVSDTNSNSVKVISNTSALSEQMRTCANAFGAPSLTVSASAVSVPGRPGALAAADFDLDRDVDIAVAAGNAVVILANSDGTFTAGTPIAVGNSPQAIVADYPNDPSNPSARAALDLNKDGLPDLAIANGGSAFISILYGVAGGGYRLVNRDIPGNATTLVAGDFNRDGAIDLVAGLGTQAFLLTQTQVDGSNNAVFQSRSFAAGTAIAGLSSGFFNSDQLADVFLTRGGGTDSGELWLFNNGTFTRGSGSFGVGGAPVGAGMGWFNPADSRFDVVAGNGEGALQFAYGDGAGGFTSPALDPFGLGAEPRAIAVGTIDRDSQQDVVTANGNGTLSVVLSSVTPATPTPTSTPTITLTPDDTPTFTPSPSPTVTITQTPSATGTETFTLTPSRTGTATRTATATATKEGNFILSGNGCSVDGDGGSQLPWQGLALGAALLLLRWRARHAALALLLVLGAVRAEAQPLPDYSHCAINSSALATSSGMRVGAAGDVNGDRSQDLVLLDPPRVVVELTNAADFARGSCTEGVTARPLDAALNTANATASALALITSGTFPDLALTTVGSSRLATRLNNDGSGGFVAGVSSGPLDQPTTVAVGQIVGDASPDLVVGDATTVKILMQTTETVGTETRQVYAVQKTLTLGDDEVAAVRLGNFNGDSRLDIATVDRIGRVRIFLQDASGNFAENGSFSLGSDVFPVDMQVGNFGGSTLPDLAFITVNGAGTVGTLQVYLNQGGTPLSFNRSANLSAGTSPVGLGVGDLDGDGDLDAVVADQSAARALFFIGDGSGTLVVGPSYATPGRTPNGLLLADLDDDRLSDVVISGQDGGLSIFLSSEPGPTPTVTQTGTITATGTQTATATQTPTETPTATGTATETGTPTNTSTVTPTGTITKTASPGPTNTPGYFQVQGEGCANIGGGGSAGGGVMPLLVLALLAAVRRYATR